MTLDLSYWQKRRNQIWLDGQIEGILDQLLFGAKEVGPDARKKLGGLIKHYMKKPHPFTSCVRDNTKRFGKEGAERVCATLKDVGAGTTKWRKGASGKKFAAIDPIVLTLIAQVSEEEFEAAYGKTLGLAEYGPSPEAREEHMPPEANWRASQAGEESCAECEHFDGEGYCEHYEAPTDASHISDGFTEAAKEKEEEDEFAQVFASAEHVAAQLFLENGEAPESAEDGKGIWKTILRTGTWKLRPGPGGKPIEKPLHVKLSGPIRKGEVSLAMLKEAFDDGAIEHVTIPLTHDDKVEENCGFIRELRIVPDGTSHKLQALLDFTDPEIEAKINNGSIANTSSGVLFDFKRKSDGKIYPQALKHAALTNSPWIDGMEPFGELAVAASQPKPYYVGTTTNATTNGITVTGSTYIVPAPEMLVLSAIYGAPEAPPSTHVEHEGGEQMSDQPKAEKESTPAPPPPEPSPPPAPPAPAEPSVFETLGLSAEEVKDKLERADELERRLHARDVEDQVKTWAAEGVPPAVLNAVKPIMLADDGGTALLLSEEEKEVRLSASEIVERVVGAMPRLDLSDRVAERELTGGKPPVDTSSEVPHAQKVEDALAFLEGREVTTTSTNTTD